MNKKAPSLLTWNALQHILLTATTNLDANQFIVYKRSKKEYVYTYVTYVHMHNICLKGHSRN